MKVCFVCNGNNSRSIMAEAIANKLWGNEIEISSCGINANDGARVGNNTIEALREIGIDIEGKTRRKISCDLLDADTLYVAMDGKVLQALEDEYEIAKGKILFIGKDIIDPKDCDFTIYQQCRNLIIEALNSLAERIKEENWHLTQ